MFSVKSVLFCWQIVDELREQILRLRFPHRVQNKEATPKTKRKNLGNASPSKSPPLPAPKPALSDRPCVVIFNKPLEKLLIRSAVDTSHSHSEDIVWLSYTICVVLCKTFKDDEIEGFSVPKMTRTSIQI